MVRAALRGDGEIYAAGNSVEEKRVRKIPVLDTIRRILNNLYYAFSDNSVIAVFILVGLTTVCVLYNQLAVYMRIAIVSSFVVICGTAYAGMSSYNYYFTLVASYALFGLVAIGMFFERLVVQGGDECYFNRTCVYLSAIIIAVGCLFLINDSVKSSVLLNSEPQDQEVIAQQMEYYADGEDYTFFELGFLDYGVFEVAKKTPEVQFFFYPNIDVSSQPEPYDGQVSYLNNKITKFVITRGFNSEDYSSFQPLIDNYELVSKYTNPGGLTHFVYRVKEY